MRRAGEGASARRAAPRRAARPRPPKAPTRPRRQPRPPAQAEYHRTKILNEIYKRYSKDTIEKVPALIEKSDNPKKFATLLFKLMDKFPRMIKKLKDPQAEYWENMMKQARAKEEMESGGSTGGDDGEYVDVEDLDMEL